MNMNMNMNDNDFNFTADAVAVGLRDIIIVKMKEEEKEDNVKELVEMICKALVDNPEDVVVAQIDGEQTSILELRVHKSDIGKVIGKQGRTAGAIRIILASAGMNHKRRYNLEILE
jgi:predicted RNA-binding protein YlqC (UPF0109 family)